MKKKIIASFITLFVVFHSSNSIAQECHQATNQEQDDSLILQKVISQGIISPEEARKRMAAYRSPNLRQNREVKMLYVVQRFTGSYLSLSEAQIILRQCAKGSSACQMTFVRVNPVVISYVWSNDTKLAYQSWIDLGVAAINQNWYAQADIVVGVTDDAFTDYGGYATIDPDCQPPYRGRIVIKSGASDALFAHEIGHTLGMVHDNAPVNIPNSVMQPLVSYNPTTMSESNRKCYYTNTNSATACTTPTNEIDASNIKFSPNPVNDRLNIDINSAVKVDEISLFNVLGTKIFSINNPPENMYIDFTNYQNGLYFLKMKSDNKDYVSRIVKH
jgi:Secretion system C-terminal sorting domain/Metallo-peptidase family M12B Reprolysin-like